MTDVAEPTEDPGPGTDGTPESGESSESHADEHMGSGESSGSGEGGDPVGPGRSRVGLIVSLVVALLAVAFVGVLATREPATERRAKSPLIGQVAPALVAPTLDGAEFDIDDHRGQWVVVNFFATWCGPCRDEHPELVAFDESHQAAGDATVVSVVYDDSEDDVRAFFAEQGGDWPVVTDDGLAAVDYGVIAVPETYLVTPLGYVVQKYTGGVTQNAIEQDIATLEAAAARQGQEGS
ncbi:MAG: TlpA disulfide reductase family protein [Acidimicrobiales bacterium]|nr:TlpA disulfide reductase family protein [Acidimicrobiales bacterium]